MLAAVFLLAFSACSEEHNGVLSPTIYSDIYLTQPEASNSPEQQAPTGSSEYRVTPLPPEVQQPSPTEPATSAEPHTSAKPPSPTEPPTSAEPPSPTEQPSLTEPPLPSTENIYLYGEGHGIKRIMDKEFEIWHEYYHTKNMRHLFVEHGYFTAEFLNVWMQSDNDDILDSVYDDWVGTMAHVPAFKEFYL